MSADARRATRLRLITDSQSVPGAMTADARRPTRLRCILQVEYIYKLVP